MVGSRRRQQPPPPHVVHEALIRPYRDPTRPWLILLKDETEPRIVASEPPGLVVWSSLWLDRPDAEIRFTLVSAGGGTDLTWTLTTDVPPPDDSKLGHFRYRLNLLINGNLRSTFGQ